MLTLNRTSRGGFILGIGAGEVMSLKPFGYSFNGLIGNLENTLRELRSLLDTGEMPSGVGRTGLRRDGPTGSPQVWVAGNAPRSLRLAGRYGDGWMNIDGLH